MASTILVRDAIARICVHLQDNAPQFSHWPQRELIDWLNDAATSICKFLPMACSRVDAVKLKTGTLQSIATILQADCIPGDGSPVTQPVHGVQFLSPRRNMGANGSTPGKAIRVVDRAIKDSQTPDWHTATGAQVREVVFDAATPKHFYVSPGVPATGAVWVEISYTAAPPKIPNLGTEDYSESGQSAAVIPVDDEFIDDVVNYVVARANMKDVEFASTARMAAHQGMFLASLNAKVSAVTGNNPNLTVLPGVTQQRA